MKKFSPVLLLTLGVVVAFVVVFQACTESKGSKPFLPRVSDPVPVKVVSLRKTETEPVIVASGRVTTDDETLLSFKVGGVVRNVLVEEGHAVKKGQVLATLDLTEIDALMAQARLGFEKAERDLQRATNLYRDSVATLEQLQNAQTSFDIAQAQLESAAFNRSFSQIKATANGFVLRKFVNSGQVVGPGDPVVKTNGAGSGDWILRSGVSDKQWASITIHSGATVQLDAFPGEEFLGKVIRKGEGADPATGAFAIEIAVDPNGKRFATGMFASAKISTSNKVSSWHVPYEAVLDASGDEGFVFVTTDQKTATRIPVVIGSFNGTTVEVIGGLDGAGDLVVAGSAYLSDNSPILIVK
jgi:RND family efflux transporter MFP subunit